MRTKSWIVFVALALLAAGCSESRRRPGGAGGVAAETSEGTTLDAAATSEGTTLDELLAADVIFEDLTPGVSFERVAAPADAPPTAVALFSLGPAGLELDVVIDRPEGWLAGAAALPEPSTVWRLEDPSTGAMLAEGTFELPMVCDCGAAEDHFVGCVRRSHSAVFSLDLPRLAPTQRLVVTDRADAELGSWDLEEPM